MVYLTHFQYNIVCNGIQRSITTLLKDSPFSHLSAVLTKNARLSASVLPDGRWLLYDRSENSFVVLNATAGIFWELCDGSATVSDVATEMQGLYPDVEPAVLQAEIERMIPTLIEQELLIDGG
jgi:hypothetical protein